MAFSDQFLEELRARAGLADVVGRRVRLQRKGREHLGLCPFHKEKTPSFTVNEEKGFYHCFGCGAHGSVFDFVMQTEGLSFPEAVEKLAGEAGIDIPRDTPEEQERQRQRQTLYDVAEQAAVFFERQLRMPEGRRALDYLKSRGLDDATIARFRLGFAPPGRGALKGALAREGIPENLMLAAGLIIRPPGGAGDTPASAPGATTHQTYDRFRGRVMFPIADARGRVIAFGGRILGEQEARTGGARTGTENDAAGRGEAPTGTDIKGPKYLNSPETALFKKGEVLYGLKAASGPARKAGAIVVAEGYMDVISLNRAGIENAVAPLGTALTEEQMRLLWRVGAGAGCCVLRRPPSPAGMALTPPKRTRLSGSSPAGSMANRNPKPDFISGSARRAARAAACWPAASPSKQRTGSGTTRHKSRICSSVNAVPKGATAFSMPARLSEITSM